jgi:hypothetical protein
LQQWQRGAIVLKSAKSIEIAALVVVRTKILQLWGSEVPNITNVFQKENSIYFGMENVSDPKSWNHCSVGGQFPMINEENSVRSVVDKSSQGLTEFGVFLKRADLSNSEHRMIIVRGAMLFFYRRLLGIGDPALRNLLVRNDSKVFYLMGEFLCINESQSVSKVFMIDFEDCIGDPAIRKSKSMPSYLFFGSSYKCGVVAGSMIDSACHSEKEYVQQCVGRVLNSLENGSLKRLLSELGGEEAEFWIDSEFLRWYCQLLVSWV